MHDDACHGPYIFAPGGDTGEMECMTTWKSHDVVAGRVLGFANRTFLSGRKRNEGKGGEIGGTALMKGIVHRRNVDLNSRELMQNVSNTIRQVMRKRV